MDLKLNYTKILRFFGLNVVAGYIYSMGVQIFTRPYQIAPGGLTGIATIMEYLWGLPIGFMTLVMNVPLLILSWIYISKEFTIRTTISTILFSICLDFFVVWMPEYPSASPIAPLMASLFGGILMGIGNAIVYMSHSTSGGTAIISALLQKKFPQWPIGKLLIVANLMVVGISMVVYNNIDTAIFASICIYISGIVMDNMIYGLNTNRLLFIISEKSEAIQQKILNDMHRGVTILKGEGAYKHAEKNIIFCVVSKAQFFQVRKITKEMDKHAFIVGCEAGDVLGKGFKHLDLDS